VRSAISVNCHLKTLVPHRSKRDPGNFTLLTKLSTWQVTDKLTFQAFQGYVRVAGDTAITAFFQALKRVSARHYGGRVRYPTAHLAVARVTSCSVDNEEELASPGACDEKSPREPQIDGDAEDKACRPTASSQPN
jgi:hypothetical protein